MRKLKGYSNSAVYEHEGRVYKRGTDEAFHRQKIFLLENQGGMMIDVKEEDENCYSMPFIKTSLLDYMVDQSVSVQKKMETFNGLLKWIESRSDFVATVPLDTYLEKLESRVPIIFHRTGRTEKLRCGKVHGDLTIGNILWDNRIIFIDPRGTSEALYYDFGKLNQSLTMEYEIYNLRSAEQVQDARQIYRLMKKVLDEATDTGLLKFFTMVHLIGAVPFIKKTNESKARLFLDKGLEIADSLGLEYMML